MTQTSLIACAFISFFTKKIRLYFLKNYSQNRLSIIHVSVLLEHLKLAAVCLRVCTPGSNFSCTDLQKKREGDEVFPGGFFT